MKLTVLTILSGLLFTFITVTSFAQNGEMNRFDDDLLEPKVNNVKLFPNPTTDYLMVRIENSNLTEANFTVHNIIGNVVDVEVEPVGKDQFRIKVKDLDQGYYLLAIRDKEGYFKEAYKFLKR